MVLNDLCQRVYVPRAACASPGKVLCPDPPGSPKRCWPCSSSLRLHLKAGEQGAAADVAVEGLRQPGRGGCGSPSPSFAIRHRVQERVSPHYPSDCEEASAVTSRDSVNNVTFLQHLSVCMSVNVKPGEG